jgi:cobaltochelatase CobT
MTARKEVIELRSAVGKIVRLLSKKDIQVVQRGSQALVQFNRQAEPVKVIIPVINDQASDKFLKAIQGFIDHEVGHLLQTNFIALTTFEGSKKESKFINGVEDVFNEAGMIEMFPGSKANMNATRENMIETFYEPTFQQTLDNPMSKPIDFFNLLGIPAFRAWGGQLVYEDFMSDKWVHIQDVVDKLDHLIPYFKKLKCTEDSIALSTKIYDCLYVEPADSDPSDSDSDSDAEKESDYATPESEDDSTEESDDDSDREDSDSPTSERGDTDKDDDEKDPEDESEEGESENESEEGDEPDESEEGDDSEGDDSEDESEEGDDSEDESEEGDDSEDESEEGESEDESASLEDDSLEDIDDDEDEGEGSDEDKDEKENELGAEKPMFDKDTEKFEFDEDKARADMLEAMATEEHSLDEYVPYTTEGDFVGTFENYNRGYARTLLPKLQSRVDNLTGGMSRHLRRSFVAMNRERYEGGKFAGEIDLSSLYRLRSGDHRIFKVKEETKTKDVAVSLVVDLSGSMNGDKLEAAIIAAWALGDCLQSLGMNFEIIGFTTKEGDYEYPSHDDGKGYVRVGEGLNMPIFKAFGEHFGTLAKERLCGALRDMETWSNVDGESVLVAAERLSVQPEPGKTLIVLSDGFPASGSVNMTLLGKHLVSVVEDLEKRDFNVVGIGIQSEAVKDFYRKSVVLNRVEDLPGEVIKQLSKAILAT